MATTEIEQRGIDVMRGLAMDAVQKAGNGHPGTAMALAPLAHVLWTRIMHYDATAPEWPDRDRFVLSNGHASMLLYTMLFLGGFGLELDDIKSLRQWGSRTPGHPEYRHTAGVEVTTGPLGQGFANGVGIALAEANLRARFGPGVVDHHVFGTCGDGCLEEGVSHEAASIAGHLGLGRIVYVYDDNHITIDGPTELAYTDDVPKRFAGYGWHVVQLGEVANDLDAIEAGIREGMAEPERPSLVILRSHIGYPSPKYTDTAHAHGNALGADEVAATKAVLGLPPEDFFVPDDVLEYYRAAGVRGSDAREEWERRLAAYRTSEPRARAGARRLSRGARPRRAGSRSCPSWEAGGKAVATRVACKEVLDAILDVVPPLVAGGADLTGNTGTELVDAPVVATHEFGGRQIHWGIREHGMGSVMNGMAVSGLMPAGGTFFVFSDYMRPAVRLAALSQYKTAFVWSHDSVGVGEDGPTHEPVEQLASLRAMPDLRIIRPADANETAQAWRVHIDGDGPTALILSRQGVPCSPTPPPARRRVSPGARTCSSTRPATTSTSCSSAPGRRCRCASPRASGSSPRATRCEWCRCRRGTSSTHNPTSTATRCCHPTRCAVGRGRRDARLGALRRRRGRDRPLRRVGPGLPPCSTSSGSTPTTWSNVPSRCWTWQETSRRHDAHTALHDATQSRP